MMISMDVITDIEITDMHWLFANYEFFLFLYKLDMFIFI